MMPRPLPDRRQRPRVPGMTVTQPGALDDQPLHILPHTDADAVAGIPDNAGNVWFAEPEPAPPMATIDAIALGALLLMSAVSVVGALAWLWGSLRALQLGA